MCLTDSQPLMHAFCAGRDELASLRGESSSSSSSSSSSAGSSASWRSEPAAPARSASPVKRSGSVQRTSLPANW